MIFTNINLLRNVHPKVRLKKVMLLMSRVKFRESERNREMLLLYQSNGQIIILVITIRLHSYLEIKDKFAFFTPNSSMSQKDIVIIL